MTRLRRLAAPLAILALVAFFALALPGTFLTARNWLNISQQVSMLAVVAATMTVAMASGDFDLSVGSMASLAGVAAAVLFTPRLAGLGRRRRRARARARSAGSSTARSSPMPGSCPSW